MRTTATALPEVLLVEPDYHDDGRGGFMETYRKDRYAAAGIGVAFVQDNLSVSRRAVLRGLHLQHPRGQDKLVQAVEGEVFDVAVDVRVGSPRFGRWAGQVLSGENRRQLYVPKGFAHGFCVLSDRAIVAYKCSDIYAPECEITIAWNDPEIAVAWPIAAPELSDKDRQGRRLADIVRAALPAYGA